jgi:hypothetical protein
MLATLMLPQDVFDDLLGSFSLQEPSTTAACAVFEAIPQSMATDGSTSFAEPAIRIWYRSDGKISFDRFRDRLRGELRTLGHKHADKVIGVVIALYSANPGRHRGPTAVLNAMLAGIVDGDLSQFFIFPHPPYPGFRAFKIGRFCIGELDAKKLGYRSARAGSDYFDRYKERVVRAFAIERDVTPARVINLDQLISAYDVGQIGGTAPRLWNRCVEAYFQVVAAAYFEDFWEALMEDQHLVIACGSSYLDERHVRTMRFAEAVSVFLNIDRSWGHVAPGNLSGMTVDFVSLDERIPRAIAKLRDEFGIAQGVDLPPPLKNYAHFVSKAKRYVNEGLRDEAFVHYVIALELLFGERSRTNESVSRRAATLVFRPFSLSITEAEKELNKLYDARSQYVHAGKEIDPKLLGEVKDVCEQVLWALLRCLHERGAGEELVGRWTKDLDYLYSALVAGKEVPEEHIRSCGILPVETAS